MLMKEGTKKRPSNEKKLLLALLITQFITVLVAMPTARDARRHVMGEGDGRGGGGGEVGRGGEGGGGWKGGAVPEVVVVPKKKKTQKQEVKVVRHLKLLNRCSQKHLRLTSKYVDAKGTSDNIYSHLRLVSEEFGSRLRIQSGQTLSYICFNKRGKLIVKHSGKDDGCIFREIYSRNHFTEFQSTVNVTWFLAFRSNGQAMNGGGIQWQRRRPPTSRCRQFLKIPFYRPDDEDRLSRDALRTRHGPPLRGNLFAHRRHHQHHLLVRTPDEKRRRIPEAEIRPSRDRRPPEVVDGTSPEGVRNEEEKITETPVARGRIRQKTVT